MADPIAQALIDVLESPNESDSNGENANVVDGLFAIARAIRWQARVQAQIHLDNKDALLDIVNG